MKSIKEKAEEWAKEFVEPFVLYYTKDEVRQFEAQHEDSFEAGANYVLEQIESLIKYNRWSAQDLYDLIEQLKK